MVYRSKELRLALGATMGQVTVTDLVCYFGQNPTSHIVKRLDKGEKVVVPMLKGDFHVEATGDKFKITRIK